jgi:hypothetical protein
MSSNLLDKAPANVVADVKEKHSTLTEKRQKLPSNLERIEAPGG